ncbi:MAG: 50S ribosomal protein L21 [Candidatus Gracilibacteria bacterium]|jgi:large subunit ribosomal protein L21
MLAIIEIGGKQYIAKEKLVLRIEKLETPEGKVHTCNKVLLVSAEGGPKIGTPYLAGASVDLKVKKTAKGPKVYTFKMKSKKRYKRTKNHRQQYSEVVVEKIKA